MTIIFTIPKDTIWGGHLTSGTNEVLCIQFTRLLQLDFCWVYLRKCLINLFNSFWYRDAIWYHIDPGGVWRWGWGWGWEGYFKNAYELLNLTIEISMLYNNCIFQCMGKIFCVEFQRYPLKFHTKYLTHTLKDVYFIHRWKFKSF